VWVLVVVMVRPMVPGPVVRSARTMAVVVRVMAMSMAVMVMHWLNLGRGTPSAKAVSLIVGHIQNPFG